MAYRGEGQYWSLNHALMRPLMVDANPNPVQETGKESLKGKSVRLDRCRRLTIRERSSLRSKLQLTSIDVPWPVPLACIIG